MQMTQGERRQMQRLGRMKARASKLKRDIANCIADPAGWRIKLLERDAARLAEMLARFLIPDDEIAKTIR